MSLLDKVQELGKLLRSSNDQVDFHEVAEFLSKVMVSNVYIVGRKGKILGYGVAEHALTEEWLDIMTREQRFPGDFNKHLLRIEQTIANLEDKEPFYVFSPEENESFRSKYIAVAPVSGARERQGTLVFARASQPFNEDDMVLAEYSASIVALEVVHSRQQRKEEESRQRALAHLAVESLSFSELQAAKYLLDAVRESSDGIVVSSQIADEHGVTRSVIVNSIRKLESAGTMESRSLGMKGTHLRVLNPYVEDEIIRQFER
ncbi:MAG: GTP-sensing pleiotropic transcriptional regulator CodY [Alicyclobacillaceae bacterium]|jgi:transcriptional pleiotropic repressor|uniref:GTP-sensing pleiotropic transcriptional regulator CodY n=1 Tax=Alicyclobacillus sp. SP_1 TaxID=2942475 RepID=UPI002157996F|nr:GTP-sensing pleiotropic transcriptional regulator CodY [Alicyclobacillus sp. SP_1]MCY0888589.1 GTP-sensing pleiotropic transcriptional regulator CodY [Alicyclobacillaceae bacterium]MCY0896156.1 GTP-sensing pleiotropic transcriptional regulator CodY [Alicyclobacillaceae bacterium]